MVDGSLPEDAESAIALGRAAAMPVRAFYGCARRDLSNSDGAALERTKGHVRTAGAPMAPPRCRDGGVLDRKNMLSFPCRKAVGCQNPQRGLVLHRALKRVLAQTRLTAAMCPVARCGGLRLYPIGHIHTCLSAASAVVSQQALADLRAKDAESTPAPPRTALEDQVDNDGRRAPQSEHRRPDWVLRD
jgi:hypothetical protein